jgi:hypothetical protein
MNKLIKIGQIFLIQLLLLSNAQGVCVQKNIPTKLAKEMRIFFTKTLRDNYDIKDEIKLYEKFLVDYSEYWQNIFNEKELGFLTKIDKQKLYEINSELFIRDNSHYYYYYPDVILKHIDSLDKAPYSKESFLSDKNCVTIIRTFINSKENLIFEDFYSSHNVLINSENGFVESLKNENFKTSVFLYNTYYREGEISFISLANFLTKSDAREELSQKE